MFGKCFGLLALAFVLAGPATSYGGWCGTSRHHCYTTHHSCYTPHHCHYHCHHHCWNPCPPCPPICHGRDCIYNATNKVLSVSVTHGGGSDSRSCLKPGQWFYFSFNPSKQHTATLVAYESGTNNRIQIVNEDFPLVNHPHAPGGCMRIIEAYGSEGGATLQRGGSPVPSPQ